MQLQSRKSRIVFAPNPTRHGGGSRAGKRKTARPIVTRTPMHLVMRSTRARGAWSFLRHRKSLVAITRECAARYGIKVLGYENVGNHLHLLVQARDRVGMQVFLKVLPQRIMFLVTGARKGQPRGKFFDEIVFSRVVQWGPDFWGMLRYLGKNRVESFGLPKDLVQRLRHLSWGNGLEVG